VRGIDGQDASELRAGGLEEISGGMVNVLYDFNFGLPIYPYIGAGIGALGLDHSHFSRNPIGFVFPSEAGEQTVSDFAYQGIVGVSVPIGAMPGLSFAAEYRFLGLLDRSPSFQEDYYGFDGTVTQYSRHFSSDYQQSVMLGFRYAFLNGASQPPPIQTISPVPTPYTTPAPQPMRTYLVFFDWDRADLTPRARSIVAQAAQASTQVQTTRIDVSGFTDLSGTAAYNQTLSLRRAHSVEAELIRDGVPQAVIGIHGYGQSNPLVPTAPGIREPQNRRVEIVLH
jgi:outer membrane protein OmpA-like peptidoglycan-associated protein